MQQRIADKSNHLNTSDLTFITTLSLRSKLVGAIKTISDLYTISEGPDTKPLLSIEIRRVIVLYVASIIEAILLFLYKKTNINQSKIEYTDICVLPNSFQLEKDKRFVVAKQIETARSDRELMLDVLLKVFIDKKAISTELETKIKHAKDVRNTFHLSKLRGGILVNKKKVDASIEALYEIVEITRNYLKVRT